MPEVPEWKQKFDRERKPEDFLRHEEANELTRLLEGYKTVIVEGEMGAGKSGSIAALRTMLLQGGESIAFYNGHFFASERNPTEKLAAAIEYPESLQVREEHEPTVVIIDSADYLYRISRTARVARPEHPNRMEDALDFLETYRAEHPEVKFILTTHDDNWNQALADEELKKRFHDVFSDDVVTYPLPTSVSDEALIRFMTDVGDVSKEEVSFLLTKLNFENPLIQELLPEISKPDKSFDYRTLFRNPRVIGHLFSKFPSLENEMRALMNGEGDERSFLRKVLEAIVRIDYQSVFLPAMRADAGHNSLRKRYGKTENLE